MEKLPLTPEAAASATLALLEAIKIVGECIQDAKEIPSGYLYARLMSAGITLEVYTLIIDVLKSAGKVSESGHLLKWIGPAKAV